MSSEPTPSDDPRRQPENRNDAGRRPGMHPEAQRSGTSSTAVWIIVGALVVGLLVYLLVGAGIIGN